MSFDRHTPALTCRAVAQRSSRLGTAALIAGGLLGLSMLAPVPSFAQRPIDVPNSATNLARAPFSFADIVERVKPAVVSIHVSPGEAKVATDTPAPRGGRPGGSFPDLPEDHPLNEFFRNLPREFGGGGGGGGGAPRAPRRGQAQGSGFVVSADGYVVTNNHVVDGAGKVQVSFDERQKHDADVIGTDPRTDLALLKIKENKTFPYVKFSNKPVRVGDWVLAVGNPFGLGGTVTAGIVSALARDIGSGPYDFMQIDAAVNRGNSGGPTFNLEGEVVGVNTAIYSPSGGNVGIAFAVPATTAREVIDQLRTNKTVSRGWLGVRIETVDDDKAASLGLGEPRGALINEVTAGGPAAASTLKAGDVVIKVNGAKVDNSRDLARKIADIPPGTTVNLEVMRYGKLETVPVKLGTFPNATQVASRTEPPAPKPSEGVAIGRLGLTMETGAAADGRDGLAIAKIETGSDAATKGLKPGDVVLEIQGQKVSRPEDMEAGVKKAADAGRRAVLLRIKSGDAIRFVAIQLKAG